MLTAGKLGAAGFASSTAGQILTSGLEGYDVNRAIVSGGAGASLAPIAGLPLWAFAGVGAASQLLADLLYVDANSRQIDDADNQSLDSGMVSGSVEKKEEGIVGELLYDSSPEERR